MRDTFVPDRDERSAPRVVRCANCDIEIEGEPVERGDRTFCCEGCAIGGPCVC